MGREQERTLLPAPCPSGGMRQMIVGLGRHALAPAVAGALRFSETEAP